MSSPNLFPGFDQHELTFEHKGFSNIIEDRGSKYTASGGRVISKEEVKSWLKKHLAHKYFQKATHNTYAFRLLSSDGTILEGKNDDGETGAGQCILREMQRKNIVNGIIVVTRYFGGVHLNADRFKHVINATKIFIENIQSIEKN